MLLVAVETFLEDVQQHTLQNATGLQTIPQGTHIRDDEQVNSCYKNCACSIMLSILKTLCLCHKNKKIILYYFPLSIGRMGNIGTGPVCLSILAHSYIMAVDILHI